jgi:uncharacterized coiled-coil protein SlyX
MFILESAFEQLSDDIDAGKIKQFIYDLKVEIPVEEGVEKVHAKPLVTRTIEILKTATNDDEIIEFHDTTGAQIRPNLAELKGQDLRNRLCIEVTKGKKKTLMFGIQIKTTVPFSTIKDRSVAHLRKYNTYVRIHHGGFTHGVNYSNLGFFIDQHPMFSNKSDILKDVITKIDQAWTNDEDFWTTEKQEKIKTLIDPKSPNFLPGKTPLVVSSVSVSSKWKNKEIRSVVTMLSIPHKFYKAGVTIMDYLMLTAKTIKKYVPMAFRLEDPAAFHNILQNQLQWMESHRNIQIRFNDSKNAEEKAGKDGNTIIDFLRSRTDIIAAHTDYPNKKINVSVNQRTFRDVQKQIHHDIQKQTFPYEISVRMPKTTEPSIANSGAESKYHYALESLTSVCDDQNSAKSSQNAWKRKPKIPIVIDFTSDNESFPPLSTKRTTTSDSSAKSNNTFTTTTIQSAVAEALNIAQAEHNKEIEILRNEIKSLTESFQAMMKTISSQFEALTNPTALSPSPPRKRRTKTPETPPANDADEEMSSGANYDNDSMSAINSDSDSEEVLSSSQADVRTSSGRET